MSTILPFVFVAAVPIGAGLIWLVGRSVMRNEERASNQLIERRREEWRAGGCVGPRSRASIGAPSATTGEAGPQETTAVEEAASAEANPERARHGDHRR